MGGGHGVHVEGNPNNIQEADAELGLRIRPIELIKHNPQVFYLNFFDFSNHYEVVGGAKTFAFAAVGGWLGLTYFLNGMRTRPYNFYNNIHQGFLRGAFGALLGGYFGFLKFGDRQKMHNAWVAERLRRRYPESKALAATDLWQYKYVEAPHEFYRWR